MKSMPEVLLSTEDFALQVRDNPKYDNNNLINKKMIDIAFELYGDKLNPNNRNFIPSANDYNLNIEGNFIAQNIPEIVSIVSNKTANIKLLMEYLDKFEDITHIGLTTYAMGMDKTIEMITTVQKEYPHIELFVGGIGAFYPHLSELVPKQNLCQQEGVNWLRAKFGLRLLSRTELIIPEITSNMSQFPIPLKASYLITQLGCPNACDFCYSSNTPGYIPFSTHKDIINHIEKAYNNSTRDIFLHICDPNAFYPEHVWKKVFDHFIQNEKKYERNIFIWSLASLHHLSKFDLKKIQQSPLKLFFINYGIESTIKPYGKNEGNPREVIRLLNELNIITYHTFMIGLPFHTPELVNKEIASNLEYDSDRFFLNSFKPIPNTVLYNQLKTQGRLFGRELPPEFLFAFEFMPFRHPHLGYGFDILSHVFRAYCESEKKEIDFWGRISEKLLNLLEHTSSRKLKRLASIFLGLSRINFKSFKERMPNDLIEIYSRRMNKNEKKIDRFSTKTNYKT